MVTISPDLAQPVGVLPLIAIAELGLYSAWRIPSFPGISPPPVHPLTCSVSALDTRLFHLHVHVCTWIVRGKGWCQLSSSVVLHLLFEPATLTEPYGYLFGWADKPGSSSLPFCPVCLSSIWGYKPFPNFVSMYVCVCVYSCSRHLACRVIFPSQQLTPSVVQKEDKSLAYRLQNE